MHELVADDKNNTYLLTRPTFNIQVENDDYGIPEVVHQYQGYGRETIDLDANAAVIITPIPTSFGTGISLILRARPQIESYLMITDSNQAAIHRHGYPYFQLKLADADGQQIPVDQIAAMDGVTVDINPRTELYTNKESEILTLNASGVPQANVYQDMAIKELARAMNTPNMFLGMADGVTEASAIPVLSVYYDSIASEQFQIAYDYQHQLIDRVILYKLGGKPGDSKLVFNNPNPSNQLMKSQYLNSVVTLTPGNPFALMDANDMLQELGIDKEVKSDEILKTLQPQLNNQTKQQPLIADTEVQNPIQIKKPKKPKKQKLEPEEIPLE
jgi:hypothetical protein